MRHLPRSFSLAGRLSFILVWLVGLVGPLPAPALAAPPAQVPASAPAGITPPNDDFDDAIEIVLPPTFSASIDLENATSQSAEGEPYDCGDYDAPSVWYRFTPETSGFYIFSTYGSTAAHALNIYTGSGLGDLAEFACDDAPTPGENVDLIGVLFTAGVTYYVQVSAIPEVAQSLQPQAAGDVLLTVESAGSLTGTVWNDLNGDGVQDGGEPPVAGAGVTVYDESDFEVDFRSTDSDGNYNFAALPISTTFYLRVTAPPPGQLLLTTPDVGSDATDSDASQETGTTITFTLDSQTQLDFDAGFGEAATISGRAWRDLNSNDVQDAGEPGLDSVQICLQSEFDLDVCDGNYTYTDNDGNYSFAVPPGNYSLHFDPYNNYVPPFARATADVGDNAFDSDPSATTGTVDTFTVSVNDVLNLDAGFQTTGLGGRLWRDFNHDGLQDANEPGVEGAVVDLFDAGGVSVGPRNSDVFGDYGFYDLTPGVYTVTVTLPTSNTVSPQNVGSDDTLDSDGSETTVTSSFTVTVTADELTLHNDLGLIKPFFIVDNLSEYRDAAAGDGACQDDTSVINAPYGLCSLRAAIEEANADPDYDVIQFDSTVFSISQTINQSLPYTVTTSLWVDGPGSSLVELDGQNSTRQFYLNYIREQQVKLSGLRLYNANAAYVDDPSNDDGAAIYNAMDLTLIDLIIDGATAEDAGAALYNDERVSIIQSNFHSNQASYGGAIYNTGVLSATELVLEGNQAGTGGGLYNDEGHVLLWTSMITGNQALETSGGGVLNLGAFEAVDTGIQNNQAGENGGGIATGSVKFAAAADIAPQPCAASSPAGGCGASFNYAPAVTLTANSLVGNNVAGVWGDYHYYGGGIYQEFGALLVDASQVNANTVYGYGGGIYNAGSNPDRAQAGVAAKACYYCGALTTLQNNSELNYNQAAVTTYIYEDIPPVTYTYPSYGGGLYNSGLAFIDASAVDGNYANLGGGIFNAEAGCFCAQAASPAEAYQPALFVQNDSAVDSNHAVEDDGLYEYSQESIIGLGGGIFNGGLTEVLNASVSDNLADEWGGGLLNGVVEFVDSAAAGQLPAGPGLGLGALPQLNLDGAVVADNIADDIDNGGIGMGGGIFNLVGQVDVANSLIDGNTASLWGGGIANGCFILFGCLSVNPGAASGAAVAPQGPGLELFIVLSQLYVHQDSIISNNAANPLGYRTEAPDGGGGVFNTGLAVIESSTVTSNTAHTAHDDDEGMGGGLLNIGFLTLDGAQVAHNVAESDAGGIYNDLFFGFLAGSASLQAVPAGPGIFFFPLLPNASFEAPLVVRNDSRITDNRANPNYKPYYNGFGGGILTWSPLLMTDSTVSGNWAAMGGAGIAETRFYYSQAAAEVKPQCLEGFKDHPDPMESVWIEGSTISANLAGQYDGDVNADGFAGGLYVGGFDCDSVPVVVKDSLIDGNQAADSGGGVLVDEGWAWLHNTNVTNNNANSDDDAYGDGGGLYNFDGFLLVDPTNITGNSANYGGGLYTDSGDTVITQTTFATNTATIDGGGLYIGMTKAPSAKVDIANSTFSGNSAGNVGGGLMQSGDDSSLYMYNSTIANNEAATAGLVVAGPSASYGAGFYKEGANTAEIDNTIIYGNSLGVDDCTLDTAVGTGVANMGDSTCSAIPGWTTDNPLLGPLQYNGGPNNILTHALGSLSPAIDQADTDVCQYNYVNSVDERNVPRLLDLACDIGAFEFETLTVIDLVSFTGSAQGGQVTLSWETAVEHNTAGYNLYRASAPTGPYTQINGLLIGATGPGTYTYQDAPGAGTWYYKLEDVDTSANGTLHGPVVVTVGSGTGATTVIYLPLIANQ